MDETKLPQRLTTDIPTLAAELGVSRKHLYDEAKEGKIRTIRIGSRIVVPLAERSRLLGL